jgi:transaldolase
MAWSRAAPFPKEEIMANLLEQLRNYTVVVADTGDIDSMEKYQPIVDEVLKAARNTLGEGATDKDVANLAFKHLAIAFGKKILAIVPGRVSTEVDARLSYDTHATIEQGRAIIGLYDKEGIGPERILIKIASTWEGIRAAEVLEKDAALRPASGHRRCRRGRHAGLALRWPHPRLVQERHRQGLSRR